MSRFQNRLPTCLLLKKKILWFLERQGRILTSQKSQRRNVTSKNDVCSVNPYVLQYLQAFLDKEGMVGDWQKR